MLTPQQNYPDLAHAVGLPAMPAHAGQAGIDSLVLKREDLHPYGSHKGRSIPVMIDAYLKKGARHFAISSSGNAALAAALYVKELNSRNNALAHNDSSAATQDERRLFRSPLRGRKSASVVVGGADQGLVPPHKAHREGDQEKKIKLEILVGNKIPEKKYKKLTDLADENVSVMRFERPLQTLTKKTADGSIQSLRQSTDDLAMVGYESLAKELSEIKDLRAVFIATSSGTTAEAIAKYFLKKEKAVEIHIVQTTSCNPMAIDFVDSVPSEEISTADAIVDTTARRKDVVLPLIKKSGGSGWIATNEEISTAQELMEKYAGFEPSPNGALATAGLMQAALSGREWDGAVVCMVGGE